MSGFLFVFKEIPRGPRPARTGGNRSERSIQRKKEAPTKTSASLRACTTSSRRRTSPQVGSKIVVKENAVIKGLRIRAIRMVQFCEVQSRIWERQNAQFIITSTALYFFARRFFRMCSFLEEENNWSWLCFLPELFWEERKWLLSLVPVYRASYTRVSGFPRAKGSVFFFDK